MGKIFCSECGAELDDSVQFCSSCGARIDNDILINGEKNNESVNNFMERIEIIPLVIGIICSVVPQVIFLNILHEHGQFTFYGGYVVGSLLVGYLSNESIVFVICYAILMAIISIAIFVIFLSSGFVHTEHILLPLLIAIIFSFIGNLIKVNVKS